MSRCRSKAKCRSTECYWARGYQRLVNWGGNWARARSEFRRQRLTDTMVLAELRDNNWLGARVLGSRWIRTSIYSWAMTKKYIERFAKRGYSENRKLLPKWERICLICWELCSWRGWSIIEKYIGSRSFMLWDMDSTK